MPFLRTFLATIAGFITAFVLILAVQMLAYLLHPLPADFDWNDKEAMTQHIRNAPPSAMFAVLASYAIGAFGGAWLAGWIAGRLAPIPALLLVAFFLVATYYNLSQFPHPLWFVISNYAVIPVGAALAVVLVLARNEKPTAIQAGEKVGGLR